MKTNKKKFPESWLHWTLLSGGWLPHRLRGSKGESIVIHSVGNLNPDNGPDFLNAMVEIEGVCFRGDIEVHRRPEDWYRHGHDGDTRYQGVILHALWEAPGGIPERLAKRFTHFIIHSQLLGDAGNWRQAMLAFASPDMQHPPVEPPDLGELALLAEQRFQRKMMRFREWCHNFSLEDALCLSLAVALGYQKNKSPMRQLLWHSPPVLIRAEQLSCKLSPFDIWVFLLWRAGLDVLLLRREVDLSPYQHQRWLALREHWKTCGLFPLLKPHDWHFSRLRPGNAPFIRIAALADILYRFSSTGLFETLLSAARERVELRMLLRRWMAVLRQPCNDEFSTALKKVLRLKQMPLHLLGTERARQFLINGLLPALGYWAAGSGNDGFRMYIAGLYEHFPATEYSQGVRRVIHRAPQPVKNALLHSGYYQQGLLEWFARKTSPATHMPQKKA